MEMKTSDGVLQMNANSYIAGLMLNIVQHETRRSTVSGGGEAGAARQRAGFTLGVVPGAGIGKDGKAVAMTSVGYKTERRRAPKALQKYGERHPYTLVAQLYVELSETVGSLQGVNLEGGSGGGVSDGGIAAKCEDAAKLRKLHDAIGNEPVLGVRRGKTNAGRDCTMFALGARQLIDQVLLDGRSMADVIRAAGRKPETDGTRRKVAREFEAALKRMALRV